MRPTTQLTALSFAALILGCYLYVQHSLDRLELGIPIEDHHSQKYIAELEAELGQLRSDNTSLRSLIASDAPVELDPALLSFVENDIGLHFRTPPIALIRSEDARREAAGQLWLGAFSEVGLEIRSYAYDVLGILPPNQNFIGQIIAAETTGAVAVYDHSSGEILLAQHYDLENIHHQAGLIRLLAIALLEQHYPLENQLTDDQFFCYLALHRGRASMLQDRFYAIQARNIGFVSTAENSEAVELFSSLPPLVRLITTFPNRFGKDYLAQQPSKQAIDQVLRSQKVSSKSILLAQPASESTFTPLEGDSVQLSTQLGALTLKGFLAQLDPGESQLQATLRHYQNDSLTITTDGKKSATTEWQIRWDTAESATNFQKQAAQIISALPTPPTLTTEGKNVTLSTTDPLASR